jgi:hypothetical protein
VSRPTLSMSNPDCAACWQETDSDGDGYVCRKCRVRWSYEAGEDSPGMCIDCYDEAGGCDSCRHFDDVQPAPTPEEPA